LTISFRIENERKQAEKRRGPLPPALPDWKRDCHSIVEVNVFKCFRRATQKLEMANIEEQWHILKLRVDADYHEWRHVVLPRNMVDDVLKTYLQRSFIELNIALARDAKTPENLRFLEEQHNELKHYLCLALLASGFDLNISHY
jgi:hypothetical protein